MDLFLDCPDMLDTVLDAISAFIRETLGEEVHAKQCEDDEYTIFYLGCSLYSIFAESTESDDLGWVKEDSYLCADVTVWLEIGFFSKPVHTQDLGMKNLSRMLPFLAERYPGDMVLTTEGGHIVYRKTDKEYYVDTEYWDLFDIKFPS